MAQFSKYDLCEKCRQILVLPPGKSPLYPNGETIENYIDEIVSTAQGPATIYGMFFQLETMLKEKGGCRDCKNLLVKIND